MAENKDIDVNSFPSAGLTTDVDGSIMSDKQYSYARNLVRNSKEGNLGTVGNEPSNQKVYEAPYPITGIIPLPDDTHLVCSGNGIHSEIGLGNPSSGTYTRLNNLDCWNFSTDYPVTGVAKKMFNKGIVVTFAAKNAPVKRVEVAKLAGITDCSDVLLWKKISIPTVTVHRGVIGTMPSGSYSVAIAYSVDNQIFSDVLSITNRIMLYSENGTNSMDIEFSNLDQEFEKFSLIVVASYVDPQTKGVTKVAKVIGEYSTKTTKISLTDFINPTYREIPLSTLVTKKRSWQKAGIITSNSNYLLLSDLIARKEEDYQLKAMKIEAEYVVDQVPADYYKYDGADIGFYRDENYDLYIQGVYNTGEETDRFHIPGRRATGADLAIAGSQDVYELDTQFKDCDTPKRIYRWQVENTAGEMQKISSEFYCNRRTIGRGKFGYAASTEVYGDNKALFGDDAGTPIRFHRVPDEAKVPRYTYVDGKPYINIIGVQFKNIPAFSDPDIIGYKITRSDRKGGNGTVIARGLMSNVRSYTDPLTKKEVFYTNYSVNDLSPDVYLSSTQTVYKNGRENNFTPLATYYKDRFSFYSPHTTFEQYALGSEVKIEAEEVASVTGKFEKVYNHPKQKLLNQFSFWAALAIGFIETWVEANGLKNQLTMGSSGDITGTATTAGASGPGTINFGAGTGGLVGGTKTSSTTTGTVGGSALAFAGETIGDFIKVLSAIKKGNFSAIGKAIKTITAVLKLIASLGAAAVLSTVSVIRYAQEILDLLYRFTGFIDYVYQYNGVAKFVKSVPMEEGQKRRRVKTPAVYVPPTIVDIQGDTYNNLSRESFVYLNLNKEIREPKTKDNSRNTISGFGLAKTPTTEVHSVGSCYYSTIKTPNPNQYGRLGSATPVSMHSGVLTGSTSPVLYGGDCIITRMQMQKKMPFFTQDLTTSEFPDGTEFDYRLYPNVGFPRFWMDTTKYDFSELVNAKKMINYSKFNRTTDSKHNLDCKKSNDGKSITRIDDAYMYLSNNCVIDFFVECDFNIAFREKTENPYYSDVNTNLSDIFRADRLRNPEEFKVSRAFADIYTTEVYAPMQREDFDPLNPIPVEQPNTVIYSLPSFNTQNVDNWQYFLPNNIFNFNESDFGTITSIQKLDQDRLMFLFSKASPFVSPGKSFLQLNNQTVTIGDGGLFAQDPRELLPTSNNYGASTSRYAFTATHMGRLYPSEAQGRIINFVEAFEDVSRSGMFYWCKNYMPINLYKYFPEYPKQENPVGGVGYFTIFDGSYETFYICKRDFVPKKEFAAELRYDKKRGFLYKGSPVRLRDPRYFSDVSWTLSYSPTDKAFISWHDWHPDGVIQTDSHFMTVKGNSVWKHNEAFDSFCNFYGNDFPFELEFVSSSGASVHTVRSIEYMLEVYKYKNFGRDKFHVLNENFDRLIVRNTEQISPLLNLVKPNPDPFENVEYPKKSNVALAWDIPFFKEENRYKVNIFWDATKDRGEFSGKEVHLFPTDESGYKSLINPQAVNPSRPEEERKKFRHYFNCFRLSKSVSGANKFILKMVSVKKRPSER